MLLLLLVLGAHRLKASALPQLDDLTLVQHLLVTEAHTPPAEVGNDKKDIQALIGTADDGLATSGFKFWETARVADVPAASPPRRSRVECQVYPPTGACLPSFMVIGVQKSGTSTLYQILKQHPQVRTAKQKELLWFNGNFEMVRCDPPNKAPTPRQFRRYLHWFPRLGNDSGLISGEFSATYLHCWCCPAAMKRLMPKLRLIVLLRDPIERARSRWKEQHNWGHYIRTYGSFEEYVEKELPGLEKCLAQSHNVLELQVHCLAKWNVLGLSVYDTAFMLWLKHFEPEDVLVAYTEQFEVGPQALMSALHAHLGIKDIKYPKSLLHTKFNPEGHYGWNETSLMRIRREAPLQRLYEFYLPHMKHLKHMADLGLISKLPRSWVARWSL